MKPGFPISSRGSPLARGIVSLFLATGLLRSLLIPRRFPPPLVARDALIGRRSRVARHSRLAAMPAALVLLALQIVFFRH
jgi:hypothetical protein